MTAPDYKARACADCGRTFVAEDDEPHCCACLEYIEAVKHLPPKEGK